MILKKYILKHFFKYIVTINIAITFLFNFIEFFEKIVRVKHATLNMVLHFIALNIPSSFLDNMNLSIWLSSCLLLKEFAEQNEWETFKILNVNYIRLSKLFLFVGIITSIITFTIKENITLRLFNQAEKYKFEKLKQISRQKIHNKWLELKTQKNTFRIFSFFQLLDLKKNIGENLILIDINQNFELKKIINSQSFKINTKDKILILEKAIILDPKTNKQKIIINKTFKFPSFFSQLQLNDFIPPLYLLTKNIIYEKRILPKNIWYDLIIQLFKRLFFYLQIIIYPILTLFLFFIFEDRNKYKWLSIFLPYPIMILIDLIVNFLSNQNFNPIFILFPYIALLLFIFFYQKNLQKTLIKIK